MFKPPLPKEASFEVIGDSSEALPPLYPEEAELLSHRAVEKRRLEFHRGRIAARRALEQLGITKFPLLRLESDAPAWPKGIVGTITHTKGIAIAAAAHAKDIRSIGVDLEDTTRELHHDISRHVCRPEEQEWLEQAGTARNRELIRIFSAKEAVYKCATPLGIIPRFQEVSLKWDELARLFQGTYTPPAKNSFPTTFSIQSEVVDDLVLSSMWIG